MHQVKLVILKLYWLIELLHFSRGLKLNCSYCGKNCHRPKKLTDHLKRKKCPSQFSCDDCDLKFRTPREVLQHKKVAH